ncbi:MAG: succinate dehydrogenase, cytochrome b556 subunit [Gammaproteobacteria bacterium]|jgi:succinate dehydrogenase / fumarate reductase cytochrome b subunit|nr:succinate dehydrogenase, cytochrome b556 subunit [Gammaproteobacteria bacterium]NCF83067.1 succinate dehydrogenase, cytochrome b556 subunit [Pseudomonadota bacterium]
MEKTQRPLSPHLQIYRPQLTSVLSVTHRGTGIALVVGTLVLVYWLLAAASGAEAYGSAQQLLGSWLGRIVLLGFSFALFYHLCNGIRHLFWDAGLGFELKTTYASGSAVVIVSIAMTVLAWVLAYAMRGGT